MTSFLNYRLELVFILHFWIMSYVSLVHSHYNIHAAAIEYSDPYSDLYISNDDDILALSNKANLSEYALRRLNMIRYIRLDNSIIHTSIPKNLFQNLGGLPNLRDIEFVNSLPELPENLLLNLTSIITISIKTNQHPHTLPPLFFNGLINLREIRLQANRFPRFSRQQFGNLISLKKILIIGSPLGELDADLFNGSITLREILINSCELTSVPNELYRGLIELRYVSLNFNELTELPEDLFYGLKNLENIEVTYNELTYLPEGIFRNLSKLNTLLLDGNKLTHLYSCLFVGLKFKVISFNENELTYLSNFVFENQTSITTLDLINNKLHVLPENVLKLIQANKAYVDNNLMEKYLPNHEFQSPQLSLN